MINKRYFYLYLLFGIVALALIVINLIMFYPVVKTSSLIIEALMAALFFYLAYKTYHEKKDKELM
ncbi:hypothetical protein [Mucilaginibacter ginkgonis]|uniref:Uncharacterized protein n=1 Tax=Mucilaginibacter ginkgonis TaxID=2682091 RepID=A0A6I4HXI0_9SPHI|nr:hypothetical protein [Mucilaginibacter ginkgonis]QQL51462.1 hypothetical protein GO620_008475 [Mucilaginibacter ginkgonis]